MNMKVHESTHIYTYIYRGFVEHGSTYIHKHIEDIYLHIYISINLLNMEVHTFIHVYRGHICMYIYTINLLFNEYIERGSTCILIYMKDIYIHVYPPTHIHIQSLFSLTMGWLRSVGSLKL